jgi:hypothetical protein
MAEQFVARNGQVIGIWAQQIGADIPQQALGAGLGDWQPATSKTAVARTPNNEMRFNGVFIFFPMSLLTELFPFLFPFSTKISLLTELQSGLDGVSPHQVFQRLKLF